MIDELGLSATVMHGTIGGARDSRLRTDSMPRNHIATRYNWQRTDNPRNFRLPVRKFWRVTRDASTLLGGTAHSINHSVTRIASHLPIDLPFLLSLSLSPFPSPFLALQRPSKWLRLREFVLVARTRDLNLSRMCRRWYVLVALGCHQAVIRRNGFTPLLVSSRILPRQEDWLP